MSKTHVKRLTMASVTTFMLAATAMAQSGSWDGFTAATPPLAGNTYTVSDESELALLAAAVNSGWSDFTGTNVVLAADLDLSAHYWVPIGDGSHPFKGTFDGQGHTIASLTINTNTLSYAGLFGYLGIGGKVQNVSLAGTSIAVFRTSGDVSVGSVAGWSVGTVENCFIMPGSVVSASLDYLVGGLAYAGGVVGWNAGGIVEGCVNGGEVSADAYYNYVGGVVGVNGGTIRNCSNRGVASTTCHAYVGGLVGWMRGGVIENSMNGGNVETRNSLSSIGGGVAGWMDGGAVENCMNCGSVSIFNTPATVRVGGMVGKLTGGAISGSYWKQDGTLGFDKGAIGEGSGGANLISFSGAPGTLAVEHSGYKKTSLWDVLLEWVYLHNPPAYVYKYWVWDVEVGQNGNYPFLKKAPFANTLTVTFVADGGTPAIQAVTHVTNVLYNLPAAPTRPGGYTFSGWFTGAGGSGTEVTAGTTVTNAANHTLYARWAAAVAVTFAGNGGTPASQVITQTQYTAYILPASDPTRAGYAFTGWLSATNGLGTPVTAATIVTTNVAHTVYADWTANSYWVVFNGNGETGGAMAAQPFVYDAPQALFTNEFERTGYTFAGWATSTNGAVAFADGQSVQNLTGQHGAVVNLYAKWTANTYTVVFDGNDATGGTMAAQPFVYDVPQALRSNAFTRTGYTFTGWAWAPGLPVACTNRQTVSNLTATPGITLTLYATWTANDYTVAFVGNGATGGTMADQPFVYDVAQALSANAFTKTGYTFAGWTWVPNGPAVYADSETVSNLTGVAGQTLFLNAKWTADTYTVTFDPQGGVVVPTSQNATFDAPYGALPTPARTGYKFDGWFDAAVGGTKVTATTTVTTDAPHTLFAHWTPINYTLAFDGNGATGTMGSLWLTYDAPMVLPLSAFVKTGYDFAGWAASPTGPVAYTDGDTVVNLASVDGGKTFLYAQWTAGSYWVTLQPCGGTVTPGVVPVVFGAAYGALPVPTHVFPGTSFLGWYTAPVGGSKVNDTTIVTNAANHTLYAHWTTPTFVISDKAELLAFAQDVNGGMDFTGTNIVLVADIDLTGEDWAPIGSGPSRPFNGSFDGLGHTIANLTINTNALTYAGLFGYICPAGRVQNVNLEDVDISVSRTTAGDAYVGGIAGRNDGTVADCTVSGSVSAIGNDVYVGGVAGMSAGTLDGCVNSSDVSGAVLNSPGFAYVGGVTGENRGGTIRNSTNWGMVNTTSFSSFIGGLAGKSSGLIENSMNGGSVAASNASAVIGGLIGWMNGGSVENCMNCGSVTLASSNALSDIGGLAGRVTAGTLRSSYWKQDGTAGFDSDAVGAAGGTRTNLFSFSTATGTLTAPHPDYGRVSLWDVLGEWVKAKKLLGGRYWVWAVVPGTNGDYPFLWKESATDMLTVTFNATGGTPDQKVTQVVGTPYTFPVAPTRAGGYIFLGWYTGLDGSGTQVTNGDVVATTANHTLYAWWAAVRTVTFDPAGGTVSPTSKVVTNGVAYGPLPVPARTGYAFSGWWFDEGGGVWTQMTDTTVVSNAFNHTLSAAWTVNSYWVVFNANGATGGAMADQPLVYDAPQPLFTNEFERTGYTFSGWTNAAGRAFADGQTVTNLTAQHGAVVDLYAKWTTNTFTVRFNANGGSGTMANQPFVYDVTQALRSNAFTRVGYTFGGWTNATGQTFYNAQPVSNLTDQNGATVDLYVVWSEKTIHITNETELDDLAQRVNGGDTLEGYLILLDGDLDLSAYNWMPIGLNKSRPFNGTFDGQGRTIANMTIAASNTLTYAGLFGYICPTGRVQNVNLAAVDVAVSRTAAGDVYAGGLAGWNDGTVVNSTVSGSVSAAATATAATDGIAYAGGVAGVSTRDIEECVADVSVSVPATCGDNARAGGVAGLNSGTIDGCVSLGAVSAASYYSHVGGVAGENRGASGIIRNSTNRGTVSTSNHGFFGGLVGYLNGGLVENSTNSGSIETSDSMSSIGGGVVGWMGSGTVDNCMNCGPVLLNGTSASTRAGGMVGLMASGTITSSYWKQDGTAGFDRGAVGQRNSGTTTNLISFSDAPGWLAARHTVYGDISLWDALNEWVYNKNPPGDRGRYWVWRVESGVNNDYPFLFKGPFSNTLTVTFDADGGTPTVNVTQGFGLRYVIPSAVPTRPGHVFLGWYTEKNGGGTEVTALTIVTNPANHSVYAWWAAVIAVRFDGNGGIPISQVITQQQHTAYIFPTNTPTRAGYAFASWWTEATGGAEVPDGTIVTIASNHTLYAHWTANTYAVTFDPQGGTVSPTGKTVAFGAPYGGLPTPTNTGFSFVGWFDAPTGGTEVTADTIVTNASDHTLYARWAADMYTVTFDPQGGTVNPTSKGVTFNAPYGPLPTPALGGTGYDTFVGWFDEPVGGTQVTNATIVAVASDHTLYAQWTTNRYAVVFLPNSGSGTMLPQLFMYGEAQALRLNAFSKSGHAFLGWGTDAAGPVVFADGQVVGSLTTETNGVVTLFAQWSANAYTVTFNPNGGTVSPSGKNVTYNAPYGALPTPVYCGFAFVGWYTAPVGGTLVTASTIVNMPSAHTLYAHWGPDLDIAGVLNIDLPWTTSSVGWFLDTAENAARSGAISHSNTSTLQTSVTGPGVVTFEWKVSSEKYFDRLHFYIDGILKETIHGEEGWKTLSFAISSGTHTLKWVYQKDKTVSEGSDCGWVKNVKWAASSSGGSGSGSCGGSSCSPSSGGSTLATFSTAYDGFAYDADGTVRGIITMSTKATVKTSKGIITTNWTFSAKVSLQDGAVSFSDKWTDVDDPVIQTSKGQRLSLTFGADTFTGTYSDLYRTLNVSGARNAFANKNDWAAQQRLGQVLGLYNAALAGGGDTQGYVTLSVGSLGVVKVAGSLSDGTAFSTSAKLLDGLDAGGWLCVPLHVPLYSKKGFIGGLLWLDPKDKVVCVDMGDGATADWVCGDPKREVFVRKLDAAGGYFGNGVNPRTDVLATAWLFSADVPSALPPPVFGLIGARWIDEAFPLNMHVITSGQKLSLAKATAPKKVGTAYDYTVGNNLSAATLAYTAKTGIFKGSFKLYYDGIDAKGKLQHNVISVPYSGVMVPQGATINGIGVGTATINKQKVGVPVYLE